MIIHLSQRRKFKELKVGTLRFLKLAEKKRHLRLRVEQWPLLLLRMLALVLLALLFARPYFSELRKTETANDQTLILLDASGSMTAAMADEARDAAREVLREDGAATLAQFSDGIAMIPSLDDYSPQAGAPSDFSRALGWSLDHLRGQGIQNAKVVVIGHFAAAQMPAAPPRVWPPRVRVETIAIEPPGDRNNAVRALELLTPFATGAMEIEARVTASGKEREITLSAEGINLRKTIPPESERVLFSFRPPREEVRGWVSITGSDAWPADDRRPFAMSWVAPEPVMIIDGSPGSTPFEGQGYFLQKALSASGAAHGLSPFLPELSFGLESGREAPARQFQGGARPLPFAGEAAPAAKDLSRFSAFALCGPTAISTGEAMQLRQAVEKGAGLLVAIDARWTPEATRALQEAGLFPPQVGFSGSLQNRRIASFDRAHPAFSGLGGEQGADLRPLVWRDPFLIGEDENWKPLATLEGGHPLLLERRTTDPAHGRVMLLAHPLTREWTDLPREPLFVPLVKSLFTALTRYEPRQHSANVHTPGLREVREIGYYRAADGSSEVVAADATESAVAAVDAETFRRAFALPDPATGNGAPQPSATPGEEQPRDGEWWPWIVLSLLLLLTLECALATRRAAAVEPVTPLDA